MKKSLMCKVCRSFSIIDSDESLPVDIKCPRCKNEFTLDKEYLHRSGTKIDIRNIKEIEEFRYEILKEEHTPDLLANKTEIKQAADAFVDCFTKFNLEVQDAVRLQELIIEKLFNKSAEMCSVFNNLTDNLHKEKFKKFLACPFEVEKIHGHGVGALILTYPSYIKNDIGFMVSDSGTYKKSFINGPIIIATDVKREELEMIGVRFPSKIKVVGDDFISYSRKWSNYFKERELVRESGADNVLHILDKEELFIELANLGYSAGGSIDKGRKSHNVSEGANSVEYGEYIKLINKSENGRILIVDEDHEGARNFIVNSLSSEFGTSVAMFMDKIPGVKSPFVTRGNMHSFDSLFFSKTKMIVIDVCQWDGYLYRELIECDSDIVFVSDHFLIDSFDVNVIAPRVYSLVGSVAGVLKANALVEAEIK